MTGGRSQEGAASGDLDRVERVVRREIAALSESTPAETPAALWRAMQLRARRSAPVGRRLLTRLEYVARTALHHVRRWRGR